MTDAVENLLGRYSIAGPSAEAADALTAAARREFLRRRRADGVYGAGWLAVAAAVMVALAGEVYSGVSLGEMSLRKALKPRAWSAALSGRVTADAADGMLLREFSDEEMQALRAVLPIDIGARNGGENE